jgi:hypothetical protein
MAQFSELLPLLREKCNDVLDRQALDYLKKAYRNFCLESGYVQQTETVARQSDGSIVLPVNFEHYVSSINVVIETKDGKALTKGVDYKVDSSNDVFIAEIYDEVQVTFSIVPTLPIYDAVDLSDQVYQRWPDELAAGAAALLLILPKKPWSDPSLADFYQREFVKGHREAYKARIDANDEIQFQPISNRNFF